MTADGSDAGSHGSDSVSHKGSVDGQPDNQVEGGSVSFHNVVGTSASLRAQQTLPCTGRLHV